MPLIRSEDLGEGTSSTNIESSKRKKKFRHASREANKVPGVQKIKSSLRQTKRLLAKDKLAADVRVETERRLKALESELKQAELANKERTLSVRYHKVKFFERQKVTRKLKQTKKRLASDCSNEKLQSELLNLRVDLNYILHYPKTKKYISLFPPVARKGDTTSATPVSESETARTNASREEIRMWIRERMEKGDLPTKPEDHTEAHAVNSNRVRQTHPSPWDARVGSKSSENKPHTTVSKVTPDIEQDDFFGEDNNEDSDSDGSRDT